MFFHGQASGYAPLGHERPSGDIGVPNTDGYELLCQISRLPVGRGSNVPTVALTAYARTEDRPRPPRCLPYSRPQASRGRRTDCGGSDPRRAERESVNGRRSLCDESGGDTTRVSHREEGHQSLWCWTTSQTPAVLVIGGK